MVISYEIDCFLLFCGTTASERGDFRTTGNGDIPPECHDDRGGLYDHP